MIFKYLSRTTWCLSALLFVATACNQTSSFYVSDPNLVSINIIDQGGVSETISNPERLRQYEKVDFLAPQPYQKVLRVYGRDDQGNVQAYITSYHPNGEPKQYIEVVNGRACGVYKEWHPNGQCKVKANVMGGTPDLNTGAEKSWIFDGVCTAYDEKGNLEAEIPYCKGELEGITIYYHPNGKIWKKIPAKKNKLEGVSEVFLDTGELFQTTTFRDGDRNGVAIRYWCGGRIASEETYVQGKLICGHYWDINGKQVSQINAGKGFKALFGKDALCELQEYTGGFQEGSVKVYDKKGNLVKVYNIKNNLKHGEETEYYEQDGSAEPRIKLTVNWVEGKIQGWVRSWYPDGVQESQREMSANTKNGILTAWYVDGSLMMIEEYDHDKLLKGEYYKKGERFPVSFVIDSKGTANLFDEQGAFLRKINYRFGYPED